MPTIYKNLTLITDGSRLEGHEVLVEGNRIASVDAVGSHSESAEEIDLQGKILSPGFIDLQINGAGGALFQEGRDTATLETMTKTLREYGVTSYLPTITSSSESDTETSVKAVENYIHDTPDRVLGLNLEGPFINRKKAGMSNDAEAKNYDSSFLDLLDPLDIAYMTVAPEVVGNGDIREMDDEGVVVSLGHTTCEYTDAVEAFDSGARSATHLFNAMGGISGRAPGLPGATLDIPNTYASFIADGNHVDPANARLVAKLLSPERIFLISDGMPPIGSDVDSFVYENQEIIEREGECKTEEGVLAGTGVDLFTAWKKFHTWTGLGLAESLQMITSTPAKVLGKETEYGSIRPGAVGNFVVLSHDLEIEKVITAGA
jgi:N-acetylglucosamine-6-phosphate deacetylase